VTAAPSTGPAETIDVASLEHLPREGQLAYRWSSQPVTFDITSTAVRPADLSQTSIPRAAVNLAIGKGDRMDWRWRGEVLTTERQQIGVDLPAGAEIVRAFVKDEPTIAAKDDSQQTEEGWNRFVVNVARTAASLRPAEATCTCVFPASREATNSSRADSCVPRCGLRRRSLCSACPIMT
jgi:hypothetical protein